VAQKSISQVKNLQWNSSRAIFIFHFPRNSIAVLFSNIYHLSQLTKCPYDLQLPGVSFHHFYTYAPLTRPMDTTWGCSQSTVLLRLSTLGSVFVNDTSQHALACSLQLAKHHWHALHTGISIHKVILFISNWF